MKSVLHRILIGVSFLPFAAGLARAEGTQAVSREISVYEIDTASPGPATMAVSREVSVYEIETTSPGPKTLAVSREVSVYEIETTSPGPKTLAVSREVSVYEIETSTPGPATLAVSREVSFEIHAGTVPNTGFTSGLTDGALVCAPAVTVSWTGTDDLTPPHSLLFSYRIDGGAWTAFGTATTITLTDLADGAHTVEVHARDTDGNEDPTPAFLRFQTDRTPPLLSDLKAVPSAGGTLVTWTTDTPATSQVEYGPTVSYGFATPRDDTMTLQHSVTLTSLPPGDVVHIRVKSRDICGYESKSEDLVFTKEDQTPPDTAITSGPAEGETVCGPPVTFGWTGSDNLTPVSGLVYSFRLNGGAWSTYAAATSNTFTTLGVGEHIVEVRARDIAGNEDPTPAARRFRVDSAAPVISGLKATPTLTGATITWTTDKPATSRVEYGKTAALGSATPMDSTLSTAHTVTLAGLTPGTAYHYRALSDDACGHPATSAVATFQTVADTAPPETAISNGPDEGAAVCAPSVAFGWSGTDDVTPSAGLSFAYRTDGGTWSAFGAAASVGLSSLSHGAHTFEVKAKDAAGNEDPTPAIRRFSVDRNPPVIANIKAAPAAGSCVITWTTDERAASKVEYGTSASYGQSTPDSAVLLTGHSLTLTGLAPGTTYHYRVVSTDACGHTAASPDQTFSTVPDTVPPDTAIVSGPPDQGKACGTSITVCWQATDNASAPAQIVYATKLDEGAWSAWSSETCRPFENLAEGLHTLSVKAKDAAGNEEVNPAVRFFFVDRTPPVLANVTVTARDERATITWTSSEPATSQVEYGPTTTLGQSSPLDAAMTGTHTVVLTGLTPQTRYYFRVKSSDGCQTVTLDGTPFTTLPPLKPNLVVTDLAMPLEVRGLDTVPVTWRVVNQGPGDAKAAWTDSLYLSEDAVLDDNDTFLRGFSANNALVESGSYTLTQMVQMPPRPAGTYHLIVKADGTNTVSEGSEGDNVRTFAVTFLRVSCLIAVPDRVGTALNVGVPFQQEVELGSLAQGPLTNLRATVEGAPASISVTVTPPARLDPLQTGKALVTVTAADESALEASPVIRFTCDDGEEATIALFLRVIPRRPQLIVSPSGFQSGMLRGRQTFAEVTVTNTGAVPATGLAVSLPSLPWLALVTPAQLGDLGPGESTSIGVALTPSATLALGPYTGGIAVNGANAGQLIPFTFTCLSDAKGDLTVIAEDEFTYFAEDKPNVAGAHVVLKDPYTAVVVREGDTGADGRVRFEGVMEGAYNLEVTADKHGGFRSTVMVEAGRDKEEKAFLQRQLVTYRWTVVPVETQDRYEVVLEAVFETHVPAPVVTIEPTSLNISNLAFDEQGKAVVNYTVTNHGLIAANNNRLTFGRFSGYTITPAMEELGTIAAKTSVVVPVTITRQSPSLVRLANAEAANEDDPCDISVRDVFDYICGGPRGAAAEAKIFKECLGVGGGGSASPIDWEFDGSGYGNGSGGGFGNYVPYGGGNPPLLDVLNFCDSCLLRKLIALENCKDVFKNAKSCEKAAYKAFRSCRLLCKPVIPITCVPCAIRLYQMLRECAAFMKDYWNCLDKVKHACDDLKARQKNTRVITTDYVDVLLNRLDAIRAPFVEMLGDPRWLDIPEGQEAVADAWFAAFGDAIAEDGPGGASITNAERAALAVRPIPSQMTPADVQRAVDRWNRTLAYYEAGIGNTGDVPAGQSTDFIASDPFEHLTQAAEAAVDANTADGYESIGEAVADTSETIRREILATPEEGVCARVRIRLSQDIVMTRSAFQATLEIENAPQNVELQNVTVTLDIRDATLQPANDLFGIGAPTLTNIADVDGTGRIAPGSTARAQWLLLPVRDAAPDGSTHYTVGGTLSYTQDGQLVTIPLFPTAILVKPDPFLRLDYFWQRDVYSDDPFTEPVEPSEPFALGLLVANRGKGTAYNFEITSSQPEIIENEKGLLINFDLIGSRVNAQEVAPSLKVNLGHIEPDQAATATWLMTSSLQGKFIEYSATFRHIDGLGHPRTSLIDTVNIHELEHVVRVVSPKDDDKPDFLANDLPDIDKLPDRVYISDGTDAPVNARTDATLDGPIHYGRLQVTLRVPGVASGFLYVRTDDPGQETFRLVKVMRSDGSEVRLNDNAWTTHRTVRLQGQPPFRQHRLHLFDKDSTGTYTLTYEPLVEAPVPALATLKPNWARAGSPGVTLDVAGRDFILGSVVRFGDADLATQFVSPTQLFATLPSERLLRPGTVPVTVTTPLAAGGKTSNALPFLVSYPRGYGDADGDGQTTLLDAVLLLRVAGGFQKATTTAAGPAGDAAPYPSADPRGYGDGRIDASDAVQVLRASFALSQP